MKGFRLFFLLGVVTFNYALAAEVNPDTDFSFIYRQTELQLQDEQGDVSLCKSILKTGIKQIGDLLRFKIPEGGYKDKMYAQALLKYPEFIIPEDVKNPYDYHGLEIAKSIDLQRTQAIKACDVKNPLKVDPILKKPFLNMIKQVIFEEAQNIPPIQGEIHQWDRQSFGKTFAKCPVIPLAPKILVMLATGVSFRFAFTGREDSLAEEISRYPVRSLYPHDVFRMSYRLNQGNIYLSLLTIENLFSRHWTAPRREAKQVTVRLANITNDPLNDNFGSWYHLFGTMVFGYAHGSFLSWSAGVVEGVGSGVASGFKAEIQENKINLIGARIGGGMKKMAKNEKVFSSFAPNSSYASPRNYLNLLEFDCRNH
jgi:hypothetical protein